MKNTLPFFIFSILFASCSDDDYQLTPEQLRTRAVSGANDNNQIILAVEEILNATAQVLLDEGISNTRATSRNARTCDPSIKHSYLIDETHYDTTLYIGTMTIDYQDGESCSNNIQKGKIIDDFLYVVNFKKGIFTSRETITFEKYIKDSIEISGTIIIRSASFQPVTIETENTTITYVDGTSVVWEGLLSVSTNKNADDYTKAITGTLNGITRRKEYFTTTITSPIVYNYNCADNTPVPVSGTLSMNINDQISGASYGDGSCDTNYTVTTNNNTYNHNF
jgi:hypothetical protein